MKTLIAYFSRTGITKKLAEDTAKKTGADLFAIEPVKKYSGSYLLCVAEAKMENLKKARPAIVSKPQNLSEYDTVVVMFPIWWFTCPNIVLTFLEENDLAGKRIIPVCTYGSSGKGSSEGQGSRRYSRSNRCRLKPKRKKTIALPQAA